MVDWIRSVVDWIWGMMDQIRVLRFNPLLISFLVSFVVLKKIMKINIVTQRSIYNAN